MNRVELSVNSELNIEIVTYAVEEAQSLGHNSVSSAHLLLALFRIENGDARRVLEDHGISEKEVRKNLVILFGKKKRAIHGEIFILPGARSILERSAQEARSRGQSEVTSSHVLAALTGDRVKGVGNAILNALAANYTPLPLVTRAKHFLRRS